MIDDSVQSLVTLLCQDKQALPAGLDDARLQEAVQILTDAVARNDVSVCATRAACKKLNGLRQFVLTRQLAQTWRDAHGIDLTLQRHLAQAEINLSALDQGEVLVDECLREAARLDQGNAQVIQESAELRGLRGRIAKQRYAETGDPVQLDEAVHRYLEAMGHVEPTASIWPGVNALALLRCREREGMHPWTGIDVEQIAKTVEFLAKTEIKKKPGAPWLAATLSECYLAVGKADEAELWLYRFMLHPSVDAFGLDTYHRQLREVWGAVQGRNETLADRLEHIMARHLLARQARWTLSKTAVADLRQRIATDRQGLEKNFSGEYSFSLETLENLLRCCASIGCVSNHRGERLGTGFLVQGSALKAAWSDELVFVTNAHVIGTEVEKAIAPVDVRVSFEVESVQAATLPYVVDKVLFTSAPAPLGERRTHAGEALDATIVRLRGLPGRFEGLPVADALPLIDASSKAYVVGHPSGSGLQISLHDSQLLDIDDVDRLLHYRTPTEPGSSGSPVFNGAWQVMGLHHGGSAKMPRLRGDGNYQANEGISVLALRAALAG